jgi:polysaccharide chain length determinant protein (PEP-CTERM system associated)
MIKQNTPDPITQAKELWQIVLKFKWAVLLIGAALSALCIVTISLLPDKYEATTTVLVDPQKIPEKYASATSSSDSSRLNALTDEVLSSSRLEQIIDRLQLFAEARKTQSQDEILESMRKNIKIAVKQGGDRTLNVFTITYKNGNPQQVAQVANQLAASFIEWSLALREHQAVGTAEFLSAQLQDAKKTIDEQESELSSFKMQHLGELPEQLPVNSQALTRLQVALQANVDALNRLDQERTLLQELPETSRALPKASVDSDRMLLNEEQQTLKERLAELRTRYSDEHPDVQLAKVRLAAVQKQLKDLAPTAPAGSSPGSPSAVRLGIIASEMNRLQEAQKHILVQINQYQSRVDAAPLREQELAGLSREYQDSKALYQGLLEKTNSADLAKDMERNQASEFFTILDPARVPDEPVKPHRLPLIAIAVPFSFLFSAALVIGFERMRGAVNTERELRVLVPTGTSILGMIPLVDTPRSLRRQRQLAALSVTGTIICGLVIANYLWLNPLHKTKASLQHEDRPVSRAIMVDVPKPALPETR